MIRLTLLLLCYGMTLGADAETVDFPSFSIDIADDWTYQMEASPLATASALRSASKLITLSSGNGISKIQMLAFDASFSLEKTTLRNFTNINLAVELDWGGWGNTDGYEHSYIENGIFYKQWWLALNNTLLFVTYSSNSETDEVEVVNNMVDSIKLG